MMPPPPIPRRPDRKPVTRPPASSARASQAISLEGSPAIMGLVQSGMSLAGRTVKPGRGHDNRGKLKREGDVIMEQYGPATYGDWIAGFYYDRHAPLDNDDPMIETLARLAGGGCALELGIGTGRVALPLSSLGVPVHGIDASAAMVERLSAKPGGAA